MKNLGALLQLADSGFPNGAFSHSFGLETAIEEGRIADADALACWLREYLIDALVPLDGGAMALIFAGEDAVAIDEIVSAAIFAEEVLKANAALARATLQTYASLPLRSARLAAYQTALDEGRAAGIACVAAALGYEAAGVACEAALSAFFSSTLAALGAAAARAVPLGQRDVSAVLWDLRDDLATAVLQSRSVDEPALLGAQAFTAEIDAMRHPLLDGRLFAS